MSAGGIGMDRDAPARSWTGLEVAVTGMACRFPGAEGWLAFWRDLRDGVERVRVFSREELLEAGAAAERVDDPGFVGAGGVLDGADRFDAGFFGYSPREAEIIDPQHRLFLESAWEALEEAGYEPRLFPGPIGVFAGTARSSYFQNNLLRNSGVLQAAGGQQLLLANDKDHLATRASYKLGLEGPSVTVQTACSTSLVAVHLACQALLSGECDAALAGGVTVSFPQVAGHVYQEGGILSADGHCRAFDAAATGTVAGNGVGVVVLRRLQDALEDGDPVRAVIRASAVNNDGGLRPGYTAPRIEGQAKVIAAALQLAEVEPEAIGYVEAHGTGTPLGDPVEVAALREAFRVAERPGVQCALGSVKTNIGHLDAAAGIASLIKTVLSLEHREIPPSLHFETCNPAVDLAGGAFYVNDRLRPWRSDGAPRRAGVSSFGMGGTNAHVVLEEAPPCAPGEALRDLHLVLLSARTREALEAATERLAERLGHEPGHELADVAYTTHVGRRPFEWRRAALCRSRDEAMEALRGRDPGLLESGRAPERPPAVAFLLPGVGDHHLGMGRSLYAREPVFRDAMDRCCEVLRAVLGRDLREVLYPPEPPPAAASPPAAGPDLRRMLRGGGGETRGADDPFASIGVLHGTLFALEYSLARLWTAWGVEPAVLLGYSVGEYVAACLAGVLSLEEALTLVARRGLLLDGAPGGAMSAVALSPEELAPLLDGEVAISAVNGPHMTVVAGPPDAVEAFERRLAKGPGAAVRRLRSTRAFHTRHLEPVAGAFAELVASVELRPPERPLVSNLTGTWARAEELTDPEFWVRQMLEPVRFADAVETAWREHEPIFVEIGPGQSLGSLALQVTGGAEGAFALSSLPHEHDRRPDHEVLLRSLGRLWLAGVPVDWPGYHRGERLRRLSLPTYPFERRRYWVEPGEGPAEASGAAGGGGKLPPEQWFHAPTWQRSVVLPGTGFRPDEELWVLLADGAGVGEALAERLRRAGGRAVLVAPGPSFERLGGGRYRLDPEDPEGYAALLRETEAAPTRVLHLWTLDPGEAPEEERLRTAWSRGFCALLFLARACARLQAGGRPEIVVATQGLADVLGGETARPANALLQGPATVLSQEYPGLRVRLADLGGEPGEQADCLWREVSAGGAEPVVSWRRGSRWSPAYQELPLGPVESPARLREGGTFVITGGLGGLGLQVAGHLAARVSGRLVLLGRMPLPPRADWDRLARGDDATARKIRGVLELERSGAEVLVVSADVSDPEQTHRALDRARERFGPVHGVFHAAGVPGAGLAELKTPDMADAVLAPKVRGTLVLESLLRDDPLEAFVLFSSVAALAGGIGQVDYCAANAFLGAFARDRAARRLLPAVAVHWSEWQWDAWSGSLAGVSAGLGESLRRQRALYGFSQREGADAMERILAAGLAEAVASTRPLAAVLGQHDLTAAVRELEGAALEAHHPRPVLGVEYVAPEGGTEEEVAAIWKELLGIERIGVQDDFFQLGGHSLLGTQVMARIRERAGVDLPLSTLFEAPTVRTLARRVEEASRSGGDGYVGPIAAGPAAASVDAEGLSDKELDGLLEELLAEDGGSAA